MAAGLATWTAAGNLSFDSTKKTMYVLGSFTCNYESKTRSITNAAIGGRPAFVVLRSVSVVKSGDMDMVSIPIGFTFSGNTISWQYVDVTSPMHIDYTYPNHQGSGEMPLGEMTICNAVYDYGVFV